MPTALLNHFFSNKSLFEGGVLPTTKKKLCFSVEEARNFFKKKAILSTYGIREAKIPVSLFLQEDGDTIRFSTETSNVIDTFNNKIGGVVTLGKDGETILSEAKAALQNGYKVPSSYLTLRKLIQQEEDK